MDMRIRGIANRRVEEVEGRNKSLILEICSYSWEINLESMSEREETGVKITYDYWNSQRL